MENQIISRKLVSMIILLLILTNPLLLIAQEAGDYNYVWRQAIPGDDIGKNSMHAGDYDGDGRIEIICGASDLHGCQINYWYILKYVPESNSFEQIWVSPYYSAVNGEIIVIEVLDIDGDGQPEILTGNNKSEVFVYDAATKTQKGYFLLPSWDDELVHVIVFADADNDGSPELACCTDNATYFIDPVDFTFKGKIWTGAASMMCGNIDEDSQLELVYSNGIVEQVGDGYTHTSWEFRDVPLNETSVVSLFDIDADGMDEIFYVGDSIWGYDADQQMLKMILFDDWCGFYAVHFADLNLDGAIEIYAGNRNNNILVFDSAGVKTDEFLNEANGVTGFISGDFDNDGLPDLAWGTGNSSTEFDYFVIYNPVMDSLLWKSPGMDFSFAGVEVADTDGDGNNEIVTFTESSRPTTHNRCGPMITIHDATTRKIKWQSDGTLMPDTSEGGNDFDIADVDYDGDMEIVLISDISYNANIWTFNCKTHDIESNQEFPQLDRFHALEIADTDHNGELEIVVANNSFLYFIDPIDYSIIWTSHEIESGFSYSKATMFIGNTDADYNKEVVWLSNSHIYIFDAFTKEYKHFDDISFTSVCLYDYDKDGISEIIGGSYDGRIAVIDGQTLEIAWLPLTFGSSIQSIGVFDVPGKQTPVIAVISDGMLFFSDAAGNKFPPMLLGYNYYNFTQKIEITDYNGDGISEIFVIYNAMITEFSADSFTSVGIPENNSDAGSFSVKPNPSDGIFTLEMSGEFSGPVFVEVYSMQGRKVKTAALSDNISEINLGGFPLGIYLLQINAGNKYYYRKLVKY